MVDLFDFIIIDGNLSVGIFSMFVAHVSQSIKDSYEADNACDTNETSR